MCRRCRYPSRPGGGSSREPHRRNNGYDATTLLLAAIAQASVVDGDTLRIDRGTLRDVLGRTERFQGLVGTLTCDDFGDCGTGRSVIHFHEDSSVTDPSLIPIVYTGTRE